MAVRTPLIYSSGSLQQMTSAQVDAIVDMVIYKYGGNPSVTMTQVGSSGSLAGMNDTRLQAGAYSSSVSAYPSEGTTAEPSTVTVAYDRMSSTNGTIAQLTSGDTVSGAGEGSFPFYYDGTDVRAMTHQDMLDTFIEPAIDKLTSGSTTTEQAGTYRIHTATSLSGHTLISSTPVFIDTRANTGAYTAGGIPETLDQPTTISNFYLMRINQATKPTTVRMLRQTSGNDLQNYTESEQETMLETLVRWAAVNHTGYRISYNVGTSGSGQTRGSGMTDTKLNGSGNYQTRFVNANDYRAQEFPNGSAVTQNTYYLRIHKS